MRSIIDRLNKKRNKNISPDLLKRVQIFLEQEEQAAAEEQILYDMSAGSVKAEVLSAPKPPKMSVMQKLSGPYAGRQSSDYCESSAAVLEDELDADLYEEELYAPGTEPEVNLFEDEEHSVGAVPHEERYYSAHFDIQIEEMRAPAARSCSGSIEDILGGLGQTFQEKLLGTIDAKGMTDAQVYTKANLDRRLFSKIRCNKNYKPSKATALALAIALGLNLDETVDLLQRAGLALSPSSKADLIVKFCILNGIHDILDVNAILYEYDQPLLGY